MIVEVVGICEDGLLILFVLIGNNKIWFECVKYVIFEVNVC